MSENDMFYCSFVSIHYIICECGETFPTEEALRTHLEKEHPHKKERKEYKCGVCDTIFTTEEACVQHYEVAHIDIKEEEVYTEDVEHHADCETIELEYTNKIEEEEEEEHEEKISRSGKKSKSFYNMKNIVCEVCGKRYASNAALKYHQRVHTGERPYVCSECPKTFTMPLFLQIHMRTHTGERPYECPLCPKAFSNKAALLRHDRVHTGIKPYECPQCGKFFTQSNSMKLHVNTVHLKMPAPYKSKNRKIKAKERQLMRKAVFHVMDNDDSTIVENIVEGDLHEAQMEMVKTEVGDIYEQVDESDILYEDEIDPKEITYEVVYEG